MAIIDDRGDDHRVARHPVGARRGRSRRQAPKRPKTAASPYVESGGKPRNFTLDSRDAQGLAAAVIGVRLWMMALLSARPEAA